MSPQFILLLLLLLCPLTLPGAEGTRSSPVFEMTVKPILQARCVACHGATPQGQLDLRTPESVLKGGAAGPVVVPGAPEKSLLIDKVVTRQMPPGKIKLTDAEIDRLRAWIEKDLATTTAPSKVEGKPADIVVTETEVRAIFQARCVACHGSLRQEGGLDLRTLASRLKGGKSGPALVAGKPEESLLLKRILNGQMPPDAMAKELAVELPTAAETEKIRAWIAAGAPDAPAAGPSEPLVKEDDRKFWSFQPPKRPAVPQVKAQRLVRNPIDAFLLEKLEAKGLGYSAEAGRLTLMRRAYLDLIGLPPTPAEIEAYQNDHAPDAYERLVDRLLASPHYGERWGQHWLDMAGYADSEGFGQDDGIRPYAWRYRDYVIRSLNADKPYAQFLTEQLAGDELSEDWKKLKGTAPQDVIDRLAATGFLRTVPDPTNSNERGLIAERMNIVADEVEVLSSSVMGLTVGCARCHNHKYDPIPQRDHYRLSAILQAAYNPYEWKTPSQRELPLALAAERKAVEAENAPVQAELKKIQAQIDLVVQPFRQQAVTERLATLPAGVRDDLRAALDSAPEKRSELQKYLVEKFKTTVEISARELEKSSPELRARTQKLRAELAAERDKLKPEPHVRVLTDNAEPSVSYLLRRGDPVNYGEAVEAGVPGVLQNALLQPYRPVAPFPGASGRRLALARWLTQPGHPLTSRVMVNQLWMRHFGRGIVASVSNFGHSGVPPSHPELLDWLATEFVRQGWSIKAMHRLMMTSQAYRQASVVDSAMLAADPENVLLTRMSLHRMDAETLYDSMLTAAGRLDPAMFGSPVEVDIRPDKEVTVKGTHAGFRRSIYVLHRRQTPVSLLDAFDQPAMTPNCTERRRSNVATQALHMMNGSITWELARYMAGRVIDEAESDRSRQVELVYLRAYGRKPDANEARLGTQAIDAFRQQWPARLASDGGDAPRAASANWLALANYCHTILNTAEFSFID